jgi:hypothetical protein
MNKLLVATIALVTVFSMPASAALTGPGSPRHFAPFQTYREIRSSLPNSGARVDAAGQINDPYCKPCRWSYSIDNTCE